jgi:hypothetical protein
MRRESRRCVVVALLLAAGLAVADPSLPPAPAPLPYPTIRSPGEILGGLSPQVVDFGVVEPGHEKKLPVLVTGLSDVKVTVMKAQIEGTDLPMWVRASDFGIGWVELASRNEAHLDRKSVV